MKGSTMKEKMIYMDRLVSLDYYFNVKHEITLPIGCLMNKYILPVSFKFEEPTDDPGTTALNWTSSISENSKNNWDIQVLSS